MSTTNIGNTNAATPAAPVATSTSSYAVLVVKGSGPDTSTGFIPEIASTISVNGGATRLAEIRWSMALQRQSGEVINTDPSGMEAMVFGVRQQFTA